MLRYPHKILIQAPGEDANNPFVEKDKEDYTDVYRGECRCFLLHPSTFRSKKTQNCDYKVIIPNRNEFAVAETYKVCVKFDHPRTNNEWDLVCFVRDVAPYDRVVELYVESVKQNLIEEDIPE